MPRPCLGRRFPKSSDEHKSQRKEIPDKRGQGIGGNRLSAFFHRLLCASQFRKQQREGDSNERITWTQLQRTTILALRAHPASLVFRHDPEAKMRVRSGVVEGERLECGLLRLRHHVGRSHETQYRPKGLNICDTRVRLDTAGI